MVLETRNTGKKKSTESESWNVDCIYPIGTAEEVYRAHSVFPASAITWSDLGFPPDHVASNPVYFPKQHPDGPLRSIARILRAISERDTRSMNPGIRVFQLTDNSGTAFWEDSQPSSSICEDVTITSLQRLTFLQKSSGSIEEISENKRGA